MYRNRSSQQSPQRLTHNGSITGKLEYSTQAQLIPSPEEQPSVSPLYFLSVSYHSAPLLSDLLHSLAANPDRITGVVIVNNLPTDRIVHRLSGQVCAGGPVTVLDGLGNMGFGAGCNLGLRWIYARSPNALVWVIHPDARLFPDSVAATRQYFANRPDIAILGTPILNAHGKFWFSAGRFNRWIGSVTSHKSAKLKYLNSPVPSRWVSDCSMIFNLTALGHCPQFDEIYFLYYEDCDLCERYFQQGQVISITPRPLVMLDNMGTTGRPSQDRLVHATFSQLVFLRHHASALALALNLLLLFGKVLLTQRNRPIAQSRWKGLKLFFQAPPTAPLETPIFGVE